MNYRIKNYVRLDDASQAALEQVCRFTLNKKSTLMREYIRECALRDAEKFAEQVEKTRAQITILRTIEF